MATTMALPQYASSKDVDGAAAGAAASFARAVKERARRVLAQTKRICVKHSLPLGFLIGLIWAIVWPEPGKAVASVVVGQSAHDPRGIRLFEFICNVNIFIISGLTLRTDDFRGLMKEWKAPVYGLLSVLVLTPLLALGLKVLPFAQHEFSIGLAIFSVVPTTLGAGVAFTQVAHGNSALALFLTVATNLLAVVTVPFLLRPLLSGDSMIHIHPGILIGKLTAAVLAPTLLGMAIRASHPRVRRWIVQYKTPLGLFCTVNLVAIVWQTLSSAHGALLRQTGSTLALVAVAAILQHFAYLGFNFVMATTVVRLPPPEVVTVVIMGSMKTVTWAVSVITNVTDDPAQQGLFIIPCLLGQNAQIFINSMLAPRMAAWVDKKAAEAVAATTAASGEGEGASVEQELEDLEAGTRAVEVQVDTAAQDEWVVVDAAEAVAAAVAAEEQAAAAVAAAAVVVKEKPLEVVVAPATIAPAVVAAAAAQEGEKSEAAVDDVVAVTAQEDEVEAEAQQEVVSTAPPALGPVEGEPSEEVGEKQEVVEAAAAAREDETSEAAGDSVESQQEQPETAEGEADDAAGATQEVALPAVPAAAPAVALAVDAVESLEQQPEKAEGEAVAASALDAVVAEQGAEASAAPTVAPAAVAVVETQEQRPEGQGTESQEAAAAAVDSVVAAVEAAVAAVEAPQQQQQEQEERPQQEKAVKGVAAVAAAASDDTGVVEADVKPAPMVPVDADADAERVVEGVAAVAVAAADDQGVEGADAVEAEPKPTLPQPKDLVKAEVVAGTAAAADKDEDEVEQEQEHGESKKDAPVNNGPQTGAERRKRRRRRGKGGKKKEIAQ